MNMRGLHARAAAKFVKLAGTFSCEVWVEAGDDTVNGKSIMGLMMLAAGKGTKILVAAEGEDAEQALEQLGQLVGSGFEEEE